MRPQLSQLWKVLVLFVPDPVPSPHMSGARGELTFFEMSSQDTTYHGQFPSNSS